MEFGINNTFFTLIAPISVFLALFFAVLIIIQTQKRKWFLKKGVNLALFLVTLPQETLGEKEKEASLESYLKNAENFFSSLAGIRGKGFLEKFFFGNPYLVFEIAIPRIGEEIHFYVASPRSISQLVEKQILGFWPKAQVQPVSDYNIFNPEGKSMGAVASLAKSPVFPLRHYQEFTSDPLSAITSVFTKLAREGEGMALQLLVRPSNSSLKEKAEKTIKSILGVEKEKGPLSEIFSLESEKKKDIKPELSSQPNPVQQNQVSAISQKASQPLFDVNLRILASSPSEERTSELLTQLQNSFDQFNSPVLNQIKFKKFSGRRLKNLFYHFSFRIFNEKEVILLSAGEIAAIFHFPFPQLLIPHIKWLRARQAPAPDNLPQEGLLLGKNVFRQEEKPVYILKDDRRRHFYIVGQTGTGKSALLQEMIRQDIENGEGIALIEPHGDLAEKVLSLIPAQRLEDVIYFNPSDFNRPLGLNMLEYDPQYPESKTFIVNELLEIFEKLYNLKAHGFGGPVFEQYMRNSLLLVMEDPESGSTLIEVPRVLADQNFRKYKLSKCRNIVVKNFWELEAEKAGGEASLANMVPYITSKMNVFIANDLMRPIIGQEKSSINFRKIMDEKKILICNLSKGKLGDINSYLLGMIIVGKILLAALSRVDLPEAERKDFYLYIDEFQNFTTDTVNTILAEARKYRLNLIFAHQYIGQLTEGTRNAIFGNVGSMLAFRVGPEDAKYLLPQFEPVFDENDLVNFDNFNGALRLLIKGEPAKPFSLLTIPPAKGKPEVSNLVKEYSRAKYGKNRSLIEDQISQRLGKRYF